MRRTAIGTLTLGLILPTYSAVFGQTTTLPNTSISTVVTGVTHATGFRFLGNSPNDLFVIEKDSGMVKRALSGSTTTVLNLNVANDSERGLLGIELDPGFANNGFVYLYYSATSAAADGGAWSENRLSRFTWNGTTLGSESVVKVFGALISQNNGPNHDGGPIRLGPDGKLYGLVGELNRSRAEQNNTGQAGNTSGVGGIYRLNTDGSVPSDNPFVSQSNTGFHQWYAYGVRNGFGLAFDPVTNNLWDTENGPSTYDEINLVAKGFNSGWSKLMGPDSRDPEGIADLVQFAGSAYSDPEFSFMSPVAVTGIGFMANTVFDADFHDGVLVGDNNLGNLYLLQLNANRDGFVLSGDLADLVADSTTERNALRVGQGFNVVTEILTGPDGAMYVASYGNNAIYRLVPEPGMMVWAGAGLLALIRRKARRNPE